MEIQGQDSQHLKIQSLTLQGFRNYHHFYLDQISDLSIFIGKNAIGKTSIIEAIQLLTELKSFRSNQAIQYINWDSNEAYIEAQLSDGSRQLHEKLYIKDGRRQYYLNNKNKTIQDLKGLLPAVIFTPDDLNLIKGSQGKRRDNIDNLGTQLSKNFYVVRSNYLKLIKQKNQALKDEADISFIQSLNDVIIKAGTQYILHRFTLLQHFCPYLEHFYKQITNNEEQVQLKYQLSWDEDFITDFSHVDREFLNQKFRDIIDQKLQDEYVSKKCLIGPHTDHIEFDIRSPHSQYNWKSAHMYASQGQQRSIVLAFKMAELETIQNIVHQKPILLLDDVMSELDETRRCLFMNLIQGEIQTFITTTNLSYFDKNVIQDAQIYTLPFEDNYS